MKPESRASAIEPSKIVSTRTFSAPPAAVFDAFLDPERLARWWGPKGFTNIFESFEPRAGGRWDLVMNGPDGSIHRLSKRFVEVDPPHRVVLDHLDPVHGFRMRMDYDPDAVGGTRLTWTVTFTSPEEASRVRDAFQQANEQNLDRLEAELARG